MTQKVVNDYIVNRLAGSYGKLILHWAREVADLGKIVVIYANGCISCKVYCITHRRILSISGSKGWFSVYSGLTRPMRYEPKSVYIRQSLFSFARAGVEWSTLCFIPKWYKLALVRGQVKSDVTDTVPAGQLAEEHLCELVPTIELTCAAITIVSVNILFLNA